MNLRQKLNDGEWAKKINSCDFGTVLESTFESTYQKLKEFPPYQRRILGLFLPISCLGETLAEYTLLKILKKSRD